MYNSNNKIQILFNGESNLLIPQDSFLKFLLYFNSNIPYKAVPSRANARDLSEGIEVVAKY